MRNQENMKYIQNTILAFLLLLTVSVTAQTGSEIYAVKLGEFINAKASAFSVVEDLGYIYAEKTIGNSKNVFIGGFKGKAAADRAVAIAKDRGYIDAAATNLSAAESETVTVIQLGMRDARNTIDWKVFSSAGRIFALQNGNQIKVLAGLYPNAAAAKAILPTIQRKGFSDAFVKNVQKSLVHEVTSFETGSVDLVAVMPSLPKNTPTPATQESPVIETAKGQTTKDDTGKEKRKAPTSFNAETKKIEVPSGTAVKSIPEPVPTPPVKTKTKTPTPAVPLIAQRPAIRSKVKRTSVLRLQEILKAEGTYTSSLDGYYGKGTKAAFDEMWVNNRQVKKYRALSEFNSQNSSNAKPGSLQYAIDGLWNDPNNAILTLERSNSPTAKAYRAYWLYENSDNAEKIDELMNEAIKGAFVGKNIRNAPKFDYTASYSYRNFKQLLQHLSYVQSVDSERVSVPCWMFERYQGEALQVFGTAADAGNIALQDCGGFINWEEIQVLNTIAMDISAGSKLDAEKEAEYRARSIRLFLAPVAPSASDRDALTKWQIALLKNVEGWGARDATLNEISTAFRLNFYQSNVLLEDYFAGKGYNAADAKGLALAVLQSVLGDKVDKFM